MESLDGTSTGLDFDQWNYYYAQVEGQSGPAPQNTCMLTVTTYDPLQGTQVTIVPNREVLLTGREWLLFYEHQSFGCTT